MPRLRRLAIAGCFFLSGAAGLMDQIVWSRYLHLVFGATSYSIATVVAIYMAGLGAGAWLFGRFAGRVRAPARLYAYLELGVGVCAVASPWLFEGVQWLFVLLARALEPGALAGVAIKAVLAAIVLGLPTVLMGGTLPLLARDLVEAGDDPGRGVGLLYGINALGAFAGVLAAGFVAIERVGLTGTLWVAGGLNVVAALLALAVARARDPMADGSERPPTVAFLRNEPLLLACGLAFASGLGALIAEITWTRILSLILGSSTYSFSLVLAGFLLGIGLGSWATARGRFDAPLRRLGWAQVLTAAGGLSLLYGLTALMRLFTAFQQNPIAEFGSTLAFKAVIVLAVVLPATCGMGMSFPLIASAATAARGDVGSSVGMIYAANTVGSILGSLAGGFFLLTSIGSFATLRFAIWIQVAVAVAAFASAGRRHLRELALPGVATVTLVLLALLARPWPAATLNLGLFLYPRGLLANPLDFDRYFQRGATEQIYSREGLSSVISVWDIEYIRALRNHGKTDASTGADMDAQVNLALRPLVAHPAPRDVLVIGAGSGVSAATIAADPGVRSIVIVEIEPAVIAAGDLFEVVNRGVYHDPRVSVVLEDGRNYLLTTARKFDIIISEPSNPWMAGVANLFTREYYALVRARLAEGGIFSGWVQHYDMRPRTVRRMASTIATSFSRSTAWICGTADLQFLAGEVEPTPRPERTRALLAAAAGPVLADAVGAVDDEDFRIGRLLDHQGVLAFAHGFAPYHDDRPELEFEALRSLGDREWNDRLRQDLLVAHDRQRPQPWAGEVAGFDSYAEGRIRLHLSDPSGARAQFLRAASERSSAKDWFWAGRSASLGGDPVSAGDDLQRSASLDQGFVPTQAALAEAALRNGSASAALAHVTAIPPRHRHAGHLALAAEASLRGGDVAGALSYLRGAVSGLRQRSDAAQVLGRVAAAYSTIAASADPPAMAVQDLESFAEADPQVLTWPLLLGEIHQRAGNHELALSWYERSLRGGPLLAALAGRARAALALGRKDAARLAIDDLARYVPWQADVRRMNLAWSALP